VEAYDAGTNTWTTETPMPTPRTDLAVAVGSDGNIYAIGGFNSLDGNNDPIALSTVEAYDPTTNTWTSEPSMPVGRYFLAAAAVGHTIYALAGVDTSTNCYSTVEAYNVTTTTWTTVKSLKTLNQCQGPGAVSFNGKVYAMGGADQDFIPHNNVEAYNPRTNKWSTKAGMPQARSYLAAAVVSGKVYALGGLSGLTGPSTTTVQEF
jgi:N-acetylneuraminic acid mutarotase